MDLRSISSDTISEGLSNDTFEITRRARQDRFSEGRLDAPFGRDRYASDISFPSDVQVSCVKSSAMSGKRKVNFAGMKVINDGSGEVITEEEMITRWWSQEDLEDIKKAAKEMSIRLRKVAKERGCYVATAHKKTSLMLTNDFQELVKMTPSSPDQDLLHWCARSDGRRGLERFASREYGNTRKDDVLGTRKAVFQEQERQRKRQVFAPEQLAKVCKTSSRRSRTFSLFMGEADAQASSRGVARTPSKRVKLAPTASSSSKRSKHLSSASEVRSFAVDAPLLTSSA